MIGTMNEGEKMSAGVIRRLEERLARVEEELCQLKDELAKAQAPEQPWWESTTGIFRDDPLFDDLVKEIRRNRRADYAAARAEAANHPTDKDHRKPRKAAPKKGR